MIRLSVYVMSVFFVLLLGCSRAFDFPEAKISIKVVDEKGNPMEAVNAGISFGEPDGKGQQKVVTEKGMTGPDGIFSASRKTINQIAYGAEKQGYYKSYGRYDFLSHAEGRWLPWNPEMTLVLRKIENPVPMYARDTHMKIITLPVANKSIGFDLIEYDWVAPYGKGKHQDFLFKLTGKYVNDYEFDAKLEISFPNKFDGIQLVKEDRSQGSMLKLPRFAPETGYQSKLTKSKSRSPGNPLKQDSQDDNNYIFRIRSEERNGKLIRAMYGKIQGDIVFDVEKSGNASIIMKYYLNPDYTRNLEFDINRNLFTDLQSFERVGLD